MFIEFSHIFESIISPYSLWHQFRDTLYITLHSESKINDDDRDMQSIPELSWFSIEFAILRPTLLDFLISSLLEYNFYRQMPIL